MYNHDVGDMGFLCFVCFWGASVFYGCMNDTFCCGRLPAVAWDELDTCTGLCKTTGLWLLYIYTWMSPQTSALLEPVHLLSGCSPIV